MKKLIALLLTLAMLFSLTACSLVDDIEDLVNDLLVEEDDRDRDDDDADKTPDDLFDPDDKDTPTESPSQSGNSDVGGRPDDTPDVSVPVDPVTPEEKVYSRGTILGNMYESYFFDMGIRLPNGWEFYDEEYMRALNNATIDMLDDEYQALIKNATLIYEMMAVNKTNGMDNININLEKLNELQLRTLDVGDNYNAMKPTMKSMLENAGYTVQSMQVTTVKVDGRTLDAMVTEASVSGITMQQISFAYICGEYLVNFTVSSFNNPDGAYAMLDYFYSV